MEKWLTSCGLFNLFIIGCLLRSIIKLISRMISPSSSINAKPYPYPATIGFSLVGFLIFLAIIYGKSSLGQQLIFTDSPFEFHVYCPISSKDHLAQYRTLIKNAKLSDIGKMNIQDDIYAVYVQARQNDKEPNSTAGLYYCGLARPWLGSCEEAKIICSSPGPMFYLPAKKPIYVVWINAIDTRGLNWAQEDCYSNDSNDQFCTISSRLKATASHQLGCAYQDPTNLSYRHSSVRIDRNHVPISPHIHGISTRPIFDGNPLSWFDNSGNFGVGYYSLDNPEYFQHFSKVQSFYEMPYHLINKSIKINYVPNDQPPGNLFYHDHPMRSTKYNVKSGLNGLYIIYDDQVESMMPPISHEKFILFSANIDGDARSNLSPMIVKTHGSGHGSHHGHFEIIYTLNSTDIYERNSLYRFRILNSHYDNIYTGISFSVYYTETIDKNQRRIIKEIDPSNITYNLSLHEHKINFTMIGADSAIFSQFIHDQQTFDLGVAERVEMLIKFNQASGVPRQVRYFYLTCDDGNAAGSVIKYKFKLIRGPQIPYNQPFPTGTSNPYTDLSLVKSKDIVLKRMRPFLSLPRDEKFVINGHYMFDMGASDNPKIGTVEDWYFINTLIEAHPIHFHLINFQVVQTFTLKLVQQECTLYEVDYLRSSGYALFKTFTDAQLCDYIAKNITADQAEEVFHHYNALYLENQVHTAGKQGKISGFNVLQPAAKGQNIVTDDCPLGNTYKYICADTSSTIPKHYRRWKDTALVFPFAVSVLRVRWAMTEYNENVQAYPYFNIPEDQLMEFPGFVYHCHILPHEDNEMMRSYMLQPSDAYLKNKRERGGNSFTSNWIEKSRKINGNLGCHDYQ